MELSRAAPQAEPDQIGVSEKMIAPPYTASLTACLSTDWLIALRTRGSSTAFGFASSGRSWKEMDRQALGHWKTEPALVWAHCAVSVSAACPRELSVAACASPDSRLATITFWSALNLSWMRPILGTPS